MPPLSKTFRTAPPSANSIFLRGGHGWVEFVRNAKQPELPVILLEDLEALLGLVFALAGVSMSLLTGDGTWDAAATAMIGLLLVTIAVILALETKSLLIGESATRGDLARIESAIRAAGAKIIHLRTMHIGPGELLVAVKISVSPDSTGAEKASATDGAERGIRAEVPTAKNIYIEPDLSRTADNFSGST